MLINVIIRVLAVLLTIIIAVPIMVVVWFYVTLLLGIN